MELKAGALFLAAVIAMGIGSFSYTQKAYSHIFSGDESATFLALMEKILIQVVLVEQNVENDEFILAETHAERAALSLDEWTIGEIAERNERIARDLPATVDELHAMFAEALDTQIVSQQVGEIENLIGEAVAVRIDREQMTNSTVQALTLANIADEVEVQYYAAFGVEYEHDDAHDDHNSNDHNSNPGHESSEVVDHTSLQMAQALSARMVEMFVQLEPLAPAGSEEAMAELAASLDELLDAVETGAPIERVTVIVHSQIHESLGRAFGLEPEIPRGQSEPIMLEGTSTSGDYTIAVEWTPADIGEDNMFVIMIIDAEGNHLEDATYDIMLLQDGEHIDETHRANQTAEQQRFTFDEAGSYTLLIENINGSGEDEAVEFQMQVIPEFPLGTLAFMAAVFGGAILASRRTKI